MIFAGVWLEADHMNQTIWAGFGLEKLLSRTVYDHVGTADVVVESSAGAAAVGAEVVVRMGGTFVTRKLTNSTGGVAFAGWAGRKVPASHTVAVRTADNETASRQIELAAGAHKSLTITVGAAPRLKADDKPGSVVSRDTCDNITATRVGEHWPADSSPVLSHEPTPTAAECAAACCAIHLCTHWVWGKHEPFVRSGQAPCETGRPCCWLKGGDTRQLIAVQNANDTTGVIFSRVPPPTPPAATFIVNGTGDSLPPLDPRFVSVGIESFEWLFDQPALDSKMLQGVLRNLSPAFLRVGGTTSDYMHWVDGPENSPRHPYPLDGVNTVNAASFDALIQFCRRANVSLIYDLNELYGRRSGKGSWDLSGAIELLQHAKSSGAVYPEGPLFALELGNELQHGPISERTIGDDYAELRSNMDRIFGRTSKHPLLYGPSANSCGRLPANNSIATFLQSADAKGARIDGLTWHEYPLGGGNNLVETLLDPNRLRLDPGNCYLQAGRAHSRSLHFALTESNSVATATRGNVGQDRFSNGFWYVASLGSAAASGLSLHARWKLWNPRVSYYPGALNQTFVSPQRCIRASPR